MIPYSEEEAAQHEHTRQVARSRVPEEALNMMRTDAVVETVQDKEQILNSIPGT
jgi:hypothetical protein